MALGDDLAKAIFSANILKETYYTSDSNKSAIAGTRSRPEPTGYLVLMGQSQPSPTDSP